LKMAKQSGMSEEQGKTTMGGLMSMLKQYLPAEHYQKLESHIPELKGAEDQYTTKAKETQNDGGVGELMGAAMSFMNKNSGSGDDDNNSKAETPSSVPNLFATLTSMGINPSMAQKFLPQITSFLKEKFAIDISQYLSGIPSADGNSAADQSDTGNGGSGSGGGSSSNNNNQASNLMGQAMGMFGK